jgi:hypothetical protein
MRSALVGIEADYTSNVTDITIELNNNSAWLVGDEDRPGGSFQVGNVTNNGSNNLDNDDHYPNTINHPRFGDIENPFLPRSAHIDFTLNILGTQSRFVVGQNAFVGFGVGTVNKYGPINGTLPDQNTNPLTDEYQYHAWSVHGLYNTGNITFNIVNGTFWHQIIAPGTNINASLLAFGPLVPRCNYQLKLNKLKPTNVMGGGNVLFIRTQNSLPYDVVEDDPLASTNVTINSLPQPISIWNTIRPLVGDATDDGKYSILAAAPIIMSRQKADTAQSNIKRYGRAAIQESSTEYRFTGPLDEFYLAMTFQKLIFNNRHAIASVQDSVPTYTLADTAGVITSTPIVAKTVRTARGKVVQPTTITNNGFLRTSTFTARPRTFIKPSIN